MSSVALFMSLGGVGYAATQIPNGSIGTAQLAKHAVTNSKIANNAVSYYNIVPGAIGIHRIATGQVQVRVGGTCKTGSAIAAISTLGAVTCNSALPAETGTTNNTVAVPTTASGLTTVDSVTLPGPYLSAGATYLAFANPTATVTSTSSVQHVSVSCTLTVGSNTETRTATIDTTGNAGDTSSASIPLQAAGQAGTARVGCQSSVAGTGTAPVVSVASALNAIQTASNS
jgi:hypothetical protein